MYQFSLAYFKKLFRSAMEVAQKSGIMLERLEFLQDSITKNVFVDICRGLFESHKKIFSFLITTSIRRQTQEITLNQWNLLLRGSMLSSKEMSSLERNPDAA